MNDDPRDPARAGAATPAPLAPTPSQQLLAGLRDELMRHAPFAQMTPQHVERFVADSTEAYYAPGEQVLGPDDGPVRHLHYIRRGAVRGRRGMPDAGGGFAYEAGELFPVGAASGARAVTSTYTAERDTFCLRLPVERMLALAAASPPFADFLSRRVMQLLELSRRAMHAEFSAQALAQQTLERRLGDLTVSAPPLAVAPATPVGQALAEMQARRVGSVLVVDDAGAALGILTRHDVLDRIALPQVALSTPMAEVMSTPVRTLRVDQSAQDAALLMSRHGIRHVPVTDGDDRVVGIVSERDLFVLQRLSIRQLSADIRAAADVEALQSRAADIRDFARNLLGQGVHARQLTQLISHLNDLLTERLVGLVALEHGRDLRRACWLAFGSEGRSEQTIATDQDNGIVFDSDDPERERPDWLLFGHAVNQALDACGYPLCRGGVMAGNPECCLAPAEWLARFERWMAQGAPADLLAASIYFDLRPVAGNAALARPLRQRITERAAQLPRFMKQLADNALGRAPPLSWLGAIETRRDGARQVIDLKLQGSALFVDAARVFALAHGVTATGTRERFEAAALPMRVATIDAQAWCDGFEYLQMLRLRVQLDPQGNGLAANPNLIDVETLNEIDRRVLKESLRVARRLQQRLQLDYQR